MNERVHERSVLTTQTFHRIPMRKAAGFLISSATRLIVDKGRNHQSRTCQTNLVFTNKRQRSLLHLSIHSSIHSIYLESYLLHRPYRRI